MIEFIECTTPGYRQRTIENTSADLTLAIAKNFSTPGERLTISATAQNKKCHCKMDMTNLLTKTPVPNDVLGEILECNPKSINIAGNGIYTLHTYGWTQHQVDLFVYNAIKQIVGELAAFNNHKVDLIRSGGQTGVDEAGLKAAVMLDIPKIICLAPKGWVFRDINHNDIADEKLFKARFDNITK